MAIMTDHRTQIVNIFGVATALYATTFFIGSVLHLGVSIPLGFADLNEPRIMPATIVEGLCGLALLISAYAIFSHKTWAWRSAIAAHAFALAGVTLGMAALNANRGPRTELNDTYHLIMFMVLAGGLALLSTPRIRAALGNRNDDQT